ncbi:MAG TPA: hypothetical protein VLX44_13580 [Xanthobacteraceae bacterium]|nr:hypothetical protein [Xanthobacteraceae bacterium]
MILRLGPASQTVSVVRGIRSKNGQSLREFSKKWPNAAIPCARSLWDSYKDAAGPVSKSYVLRGTYAPQHRVRNVSPFEPDQDAPLAREHPATLQSACRKEHPMMDVVMLAIAFVFFALSVGYVLACDRL